MQPSRNLGRRIFIIFLGCLLTVALIIGMIFGYGRLIEPHRHRGQTLANPNAAPSTNIGQRFQSVFQSIGLNNLTKGGRLNFFSTSSNNTTSTHRQGETSRTHLSENQDEALLFDDSLRRRRPLGRHSRHISQSIQIVDTIGYLTGHDLFSHDNFKQIINLISLSLSHYYFILMTGLSHFRCLCVCVYICMKYILPFFFFQIGIREKNRNSEIHFLPVGSSGPPRSDAPRIATESKDVWREQSMFPSVIII